MTGAGTLGSVLGLFYTYASRQNGKLTRAVLTDSDEKTRELIRQGHDLMRAMHEDNKGFHEENTALLQEVSRFSKTAHEENKALLTTLVELLKRNGSRS